MIFRRNGKDAIPSNDPSSNASGQTSVGPKATTFRNASPGRFRNCLANHAAVEPRGSVSVGWSRYDLGSKHSSGQPTASLAVEQAIRSFSNAAAAVAATQFRYPRDSDRVNSGHCESKLFQRYWQPSPIGSPTSERRWCDPNGPLAADNWHAIESPLDDSVAPLCDDTSIRSNQSDNNPCASSVGSFAADSDRGATIPCDPPGNGQTARPDPSTQLPRFQCIASQHGCRSQPIR